MPGIFLLLGDSRAYGLDSCNRHLRIGDITVPRHIASVLNFKQFFRYDRRVVTDETSGEIVSTGETAVAQRIHGIGQFPSALKVYPIFSVHRKIHTHFNSGSNVDINQYIHAQHTALLQSIFFGYFSTVVERNECNDIVLLLLKSERRILHNVGYFRSREQPYISPNFQGIKRTGYRHVHICDNRTVNSRFRTSRRFNRLESRCI